MVRTRLTQAAALLTTCIVLSPVLGDEPKGYPDPTEYPVEPEGEEAFLKMWSREYPGTDRFTINVNFCGGTETGGIIRVGVALVRSADEKDRIVYQGRLESQASRDNLKSLARVGNLHHWDNVFLVDYSGTEPFRLDGVEVRVRSSSGRLGPWSSIPIAGFPSPLGGEAAPWVLTSTSRLRLDTEGCRIQFFARYLPRGYEWAKAPASARRMMLDLGKCGTNANDPTCPENPKFGYPGGCSETVSWYDFEFGEPRSFYVKFKDVECWWQMSAIFEEQKRLYSWNKQTQRFERSATDGLLSIDPKPGDDFFWDDRLPGGDGGVNGDAPGHVMKIVSFWRGNDASKHFLYMDGSYPIRLKKMYAGAMTDNTRMGFCMGRVPEND